MAVIAIPEILREKLGADGAEALAELLNRTSIETRDDVITLAEQSFERRLAEEIARVGERIGAAETRLIRWMLVFWVGQALFVVTLLFGFFGG